MLMMPSKQREAARPHEKCGRLVGEEWSIHTRISALLEESRSKACSTQGEQSHYRSGELGLGIHGFIPT